MTPQDEKRLKKVRDQLFALSRKIASRQKAAVEAQGDHGLPTLTEDEQRAFKVLQALHDSLIREAAASKTPPVPYVVDITKVPTEVLLEILEKSRNQWSIA